MKIIKEDEDWPFEIEFYEKLLRSNPDFVQALVMLGELYTKAGMYQKGFEMDLHLAQLRPEDPIVLYNLACSYSLLGEINKAFPVMQLAIDCGYDDLNHLTRDKDLKNLLNDSRFKDYLSRINTNSTQTAI